MEEMKHDELDKLMRSRLLDDSPADNQWNVPPDDVFEKAIAAIPEKPKKDRRFLLFIPLFLFLSIATYFALNTYNKIDNLEAEIVRLKNEKEQNVLSALPSEEKIENKTVTNNNSSINGGAPPAITAKTITGRYEPVAGTSTNISSKPSTGNVASTPALVHDKASFSAQAQATIKKPELIGSDVEIRRTPTNAATATVVSPVSSSQALAESAISFMEKTSEGHNTSGMNRQEMAVDEMALLEIVPLAVEPGILNQLAPVSPPRIQSKSNNKTNIFVFAGAHATALHMTNSKEEPFSLTGYDKSQWSYQLGIGVERKIAPKLVGRVTLDFMRFANKSYYQGQFLYDKNNEQINTDGSVDYVSSIKIESPVHSMEHQAKFRVDDQVLQHNDIMDNKTDIDQWFSALGASLGLEYTVARFGNLNATLGGGLHAQYVTSYVEHLNMKLYHQGSMMLDQNMDSSSPSNINRTLASVYVNAGLNYAISKHFSLNLLGEYDHGISSIRPSTPDDDASAYLRSLRLSLGLKYSF